MKKILIIMMTAVILLMSACSGGENSVPAGMKALSDENDEYYLYIPESWNADTSMGIDSAYNGDSSRPDDLSNISFIGFSGYADLESFWNDNKKTVEDTYKDISFEIESEQMLVADKTAVKYVYTAEVAGVKYKFMQIAIYNSSYVYLFTYTALDKYYSEHYGDASKDVNMILDNLSFK